MRRLVDVPEIKEGIEHLINQFPDLQHMAHDPFASLGYRVYDDPFRGLVRIVTGQQISTKAADSVWLKLKGHLGEDFTYIDILSAQRDDLQSCGLSFRKTDYIIGLAQNCESGAFPLERLETLSDDKISKHILELKGFGPWSVDMFLMFCMARPNIWADGDLVVRLGLQKLLGLDAEPSKKILNEYREKFSPHGTAASLLMWHMKLHE